MISTRVKALNDDVGASALTMLGLAGGGGMSQSLAESQHRVAPSCGTSIQNGKRALAPANSRAPFLPW